MRRAKRDTVFTRVKEIPLTTFPQNAFESKWPSGSSRPLVHHQTQRNLGTRTVLSQPALPWSVACRLPTKPYSCNNLIETSSSTFAHKSFKTQISAAKTEFAAVEPQKTVARPKFLTAAGRMCRGRKPSARKASALPHSHSNAWQIQTLVCTRSK